MKSIRVGAVVCLFTITWASGAAAQALNRSGSGQVQAEPEAPARQRTLGGPAKRTPAPATTGEVSAHAVPRLIKFSGVLQEASGRPFVPLGGTQGERSLVALTFALYQEQAGGAPLWLETQNVELDAQGRYTVLLGATKSEGLPLELFAAGEARWLGIQAWGEEEQPRILLVSVPYALKAEEAEKLAGRRLEDFVLAEQLQQQVREVVQTEAQTLGLQPKLQTSGEPGAAAVLAGATNFVDTTADQVVQVTQQGAGLALSAQAPSNTAILGVSNATTGAFFGVRGESFSAEGNGVFGFNRAAAGTAIAVRGLSLSPGGRGVLGEARAATGATFGVQGLNLSTSGVGVYGVATATSGGTVGVKGETFSTSGTGVIGVARGLTGVTAGLSGVTESNSGRGLFGLAVAPSGPTIGLLGIAHSPAGFAGVFDNKGGGKILSLRNNTVEKAAFDGSGNLTASGSVTAASFSGSGSGLTSLNASNLASGTVPSAVFAGTYSNAVSFTSAANSFSGSFSGDGAALSNVNAVLLNGIASSGFVLKGGDTMTGDLALPNLTASGNVTAATLRAGNISLTSTGVSGADATSPATSLTLKAGNSPGITVPGGAISLISGSGGGSGFPIDTSHGGDIALTASVGNNARGGNIALTAGETSPFTTAPANAFVQLQGGPISPATGGRITAGGARSAGGGGGASPNNAGGVITIEGGNGNGTGAAGDILLLPGTAGDGVTKGNVGIGTASPAQKLEVAGNVKISGVGSGLTFPDGTTQTTAAAGGGGISDVTGTAPIAVTSPTLNTRNIALNPITDANIAVGANIAAAKINRTGLDADLLDGLDSTTFAPASGSANYVAKTGDTMTGALIVSGADIRLGDSSSVNALDVFSSKGVSISDTTAFSRTSVPAGTLVVSGNVGIGTAAPSEKLTVVGSTPNPLVKITSSSAVFSTEALHVEATHPSTGGRAIMGLNKSFQGTGVFGWADATGGTTSGLFGRVDSPTGRAVELLVTNSGAALIFARHTSLGTVFRVDGDGDVFADRSYNCGFPSGCFNTGVGADVAERIDVTEQLEPGDMVEIDPSNPEHFRKARAPYSPLVAGVVSTAPAITLANNDLADNDSGVRTDTRPLLALVGRVPLKVTDEGGPIRIGDLLTSSSTPGYAMRCAERLACAGAIVGKALQPLAAPTGVIQVLVTLQ